MVRIERDSKIEQVDTAMPKSYWLRTRKPTVDYLRDTPFAIDRQLEDIRLQQQNNRNPQFYIPTKVDKVRSQLIVAAKGESRAVAMKANAVNKFVRDASGIHNYTIVAPPRQVTKDLHEKEVLEPETNPRVRAYATEAKMKPILCSFGHRPSSASRTFHPATMKLRLRHGAIVPALEQHKTTLGMPVAVLKKVINAPPILGVFDEVQNASHSNSTSKLSPMNSKPGSPAGAVQPSYNDLFLSKEEQDSLFSQSRGDRSTHSGRSSKHHLKPLNSRSQASWVSDDIASNSNEFLLSPKEDKPVWNEGFHRIDLPSNHVFKLKASGLNVKTKVPLGELLHRFESLSVAENQLHPFCTEKQELDKLQRSGIISKIPKSKPIKGQKLYYDPLEYMVKDLQKHHKEAEEVKTCHRKVKQFHELLKTIPKVDYYPTTKLAEIKDGGSKNSDEGEFEQEGDNGTSKSMWKLGNELESRYPGWERAEDNLKEYLKQAKQSVEMLYETNVSTNH